MMPTKRSLKGKLRRLRWAAGILCGLTWLLGGVTAHAQGIPAGWQPLSGPPGRISHLAASPDGADLYAVSVAATQRADDQTQWQNSGKAVRSDALYRSQDGGATWQPLTNDLPPAPITALYAGPKRALRCASGRALAKHRPRRDLAPHLVGPRRSGHPCHRLQRRRGHPLSRCDTDRSDVCQLCVSERRRRSLLDQRRDTGQPSRRPDRSSQRCQAALSDDPERPTAPQHRCGRDVDNRQNRAGGGDAAGRRTGPPGHQPRWARYVAARSLLRLGKRR